MIKAVLFDYGGVVCHGGKPGMLSDNLAANLDIPNEHANILLEYGFNKIKRGLIDENEFWTILEKAHGSSIPADKRDIWMKWEQIIPIPQVVNLRDKLKKAGIVTGILSNVEPTVMNILREHGAYSGYDNLTLSCEVGYAKPEPEIYALALDKLAGIAAHEILFVDDQESMLEPAARLGMHTVLAVDTQQIVSDISSATRINS